MAQDDGIIFPQLRTPVFDAMRHAVGIEFLVIVILMPEHAVVTVLL